MNWLIFKYFWKRIKKALIEIETQTTFVLGKGNCMETNDTAREWANDENLVSSV